MREDPAFYCDVSQVFEKYCLSKMKLYISISFIQTNVSLKL